MGLFTKKPKKDTEHHDYVSSLIKEELEAFQKEVDDLYSYRTDLSPVNRGLVDCFFPLDAYNVKKKDAMLIRYELAYYDQGPYFSAFTMYIRTHFIDLFLHPEDIHKSGYEKLNTCSLRPIRTTQEKEDVAAWGLENTEAVKFIREGFKRISTKIDNHIMAQFGTVSYSNLPDEQYRIRCYYQTGNPEQYKEYFANIAKAVPYYASDAKKYALQLGLTLTDEDIRNSKGINYLVN